MDDALVGRCFLGFHNNAYRSGVIERALDNDYYLVRFDEFVGFEDGTKWLEALAVVAISDMARPGREFNDPPPWSLFDDVGQRAKYQAWLNDLEEKEKAPLLGVQRDRH